ncbi:MAG: hypothetical protein QM756_08810 [Polyangiaceae bacterium]
MGVSDQDLRGHHHRPRHHHHGHDNACASSSDCGPDSYCAAAAGACGGPGTCQSRPTICTFLYKPVCGCDDITYGNACAAAAAGISVVSEGECPGVFCGGIAGFPCPGSGECVDDPSDDCDPNNGGADCGGLCQCAADATCGSGEHFNRSPKVCACESDGTATNPCAAVLCIEGTQCVVVDGKASCEPIVDACATVRCAAGTHCVASGSTATCQPD